MNTDKEKKIRFGVIGTNFISDWVIVGARQDPRFELTAVYSRTQERADKFAAKHQIPYTFTSLEAMASSPLVDAVYIASPNFLHGHKTLIHLYLLIDLGQGFIILFHVHIIYSLTI